MTRASAARLLYLQASKVSFLPEDLKGLDATRYPALFFINVLVAEAIYSAARIASVMRATSAISFTS